MGNFSRYFRVPLLVPVFLSLLWQSPAAARNYKPVVFLRHPEVVGASTPFVEVQNFRINQDDRIVVGKSPRHNRREYKNLYRAKFEDLQLLEWSATSGMMRVVMANGTAGDHYCYPSKAEPREEAMIESTVMLAVQVTGEFVLQGKKTRKQIPLAEIRAIVFVDEAETTDGAAYRWAKSHDTAEAWREFIRIFPNSRRAASAGDSLVQLLVNEAGNRLATFQQGGPLAAAIEARKTSEEILKFRANEPRAAELRDRAVSAENQVRTQVEQLTNLVNQQKWDEAIEVHKAVARFAPEIASITEAERKALRGSHDAHRQKGQDHLKAERFEQAIAEFKLALGRLDDKDTKQELREASIRLVLRDGGRAVANNQLESAHQMLQASLKEQGADSRTLQLQARVKKAWAEQLLAEAKPMYTVPVPKSQKAPPKGPARKVEIDGPAAETRHVAALERLEKANELWPLPETEALVSEVRTRLASYYFKLGQKKLALPKGAGAAQALLYFQRASGYDSQLPGLPEAEDKARETFQRKASIGVNIAFTDKSARRACGHMAAEIEGLVGSDVTNARLPGVQVVERDEFEKLEAEQRLSREHSQSGMTLDVKGATVQVLGDILTCESRRRETPSRMPSQYVSGQRENPEYYRLVRLRDQYNAQAEAIDREDDRYKACSENEQRQKIYGTCRQIREQYRAQYNEITSQLQNVVAALANAQPQFPIITSYTYLRKNISVEARLKVGFRIVDSLTAVRREQELLSEEETKQGIEIQGAMPQDTGNVTDRLANLPSEEELLGQQVTKVHRKLTYATTTFLRGLPEKYLERARQAKERGASDDAAENYILFLATTPQKSGKTYEEAAAYLRKERNLVYRADVR